MSGPAIWSNGASVDGRISVTDRGFQLGDGVFDTLTAFAGTPFAGERHLGRLQRHAAAIGIGLEPDIVRRGWAAILAAGTPAPTILRTTVTRGTAPRGLWPREAGSPSLVVTASAWSPALAGAPQRLVTSTIRRNETSPTSRLKTLNYLDNILAAREAAAAGADDALLLNGAGMACCTTIGNLFALAGRTLTTPPLADGVMDGVLRGLVMEIAPRLGLTIREASVPPEALASSDAVFITNSVRFLAPVTSLDGTTLQSHAPVLGELRAALTTEVARCCTARLEWPAAG